jgi:hypothetical protein
MRLDSPVDEHEDVVEGERSMMVAALAEDGMPVVAAFSGLPSSIVDGRNDQKKPADNRQQLVSEDTVL